MSAFAKRQTRGERQRTLDEAREVSRHGGWRPGAGRKKVAKRKAPAHRVRAEFRRDQPVHVVLKVVPEVGRLRRPMAYGALHEAAAHVLGRGDFRIVHVSIQHNHVHLLVEADDKEALARGVQAFEIVAAKKLNKALGRPRGKVFLHRYYATVLSTPQQVRACIAYVLDNWRRHREDRRGQAQRAAKIDPYASGIRFDGWRGTAGAFAAPFDPPEGYQPLPTAPPTVWLLTTGWRRHGPIDCREVPGPLAGT